MSEKPKQKITGECFCGELKYQIDEPIQDATFCHCSRCRKAFGGAGSSFSIVTDGAFSWLSGENNLQTYVGKEGWGIGFCKKCGSTLCGVYQGKVAGISIGTLNNDPPVKIQKHVYVGSKTCWDVIGGDAPQYIEAGGNTPAG